MSARLRLGVNIDHVATIRNARGGAHPDPVRAAILAEEAGADGITLHVREDRRHVREADLERLAEAVNIPINLEMACAEEMLAIALKARPHAVCLVPERREERTTEGGLDVAGRLEQVRPFVAALSEAGARVSLFIAPEPAQIEAAAALRAPVIELHTGAYCDALREDDPEAAGMLEGLKRAARLGQSLGLEVHAGHGIDYRSVTPVAAIEQLAELNIGHFLVGEAVYVGFKAAIAQMRSLMDQARQSGS